MSIHIKKIEEEDYGFNSSQVLLFPLCALSLFSLSIRASACNQTCRSTTVPYPFGFSPDCTIQLNCSTAGELLLAGFNVNELAADHILLDVSPTCGRPVSKADDLYGPYYALSWRNMLFLQNCNNASASTCQMTTSLITRQMNTSSCPGGKANGYDDVSCFSSQRSEGLLWPENFTVGNCQYYFVSVIYNQEALTFRTADLVWWLNGECQCSDNANCTRVDTLKGTAAGFHCSCLGGFIGDGYAAGTGCYRALDSRCDSSCWNTIKIGVLVGGVLAGAALLIGTVLLYKRIQSYKFSKIRLTTQRLLSGSSRSVTIFSFKDIERATGNFSAAHRLGSGAYGTVYKGKFPDNQVVAIKRLMKRGSIDNDLQRVINEIKLISSVSHPNLVQLLGCCFEGHESILVYEFIPNGTLYEHLHQELGSGLPWPTRVLIGAESAKAIAYLHTAVHPPIYHRDVKSSNILLDDALCPKIADFGLSRTGMVEVSHITTMPQGTPGYVDPQYHQDFHLSDKSDVYSLGVVLLELITAMKVVDFGRSTSEVNLAAMAVDRIGKGLVEEIVDPFLKAGSGCGGEDWKRMKSSIEKVAELAFRCLAFLKDVRPSMMEVAEVLEQVRVEVFSMAELQRQSSRSGATTTTVTRGGGPVQEKLIEEDCLDQTKTLICY